MATTDERRSDRISLQVPIRIAGTDALGVSFVDDAQTVIVNRHGAKILARRRLVPDQELNITCAETRANADGRVLGQIGQAEQGYYYGIAFLNETVNPWGIHFPALDKGQDAAGRAVLECVGCHIREVAYLNEFEIEVLEANASITRYCMKCTESTLWKRSQGEAPAAAPEAPPAEAEPGRDKRREPRRELRVRACIRSVEFGEEIVWTRNVSRGGLCFESLRTYGANWKIEASIPYTPGAANIFLPAKIARVQRLEPSGTVLCGVSYVRFTAARKPAG